MSRLVSVAVAFTLVVAACGDDSDGSDEATGTTEAPSPEETVDDAVFPGEEWEHADPNELGFDPDELERLASEAETQDTECLMVVRDGKVAGEWSWGAAAEAEDDEPWTREAFSATKSFSSTLVGIAQAEGLLDIEDKVSEYVPEWSGVPETEDITIRNLLSNDSGRQLDSELEYGPEGLGAQDDQNAFAIGLEQEAPPGTTWGYNNAAIQVLDEVLQEATGQDTASYAQEKLLEPIGMASSEMTQDPSGNTLTYMGLQSNCQEMARYGHLFLHKGNWDGDQVVPEEWADEATGQPSQELNAAYGYLWWLNRPGPFLTATDALEAHSPDEIEEGQYVEDAPEDMYFALGLNGQMIGIDPGSGTVVTRMGGGGGFGVQELADMVTKTGA